MSSLIDLPWLPRPPADFREQLRVIERAVEPADWGTLLRGLATHALDVNQSLALSRTLGRLSQKYGRSRSLAAFKLGVVSNFTTDFANPLLAAAALRYGVQLEIVAADFGQAVQQAVDPESKLNRAKLDAVLVALDPRELSLRSSRGADWPLFDAQLAIDEIELIRSGFRTHGAAPCLVQTLPSPAELLFGSLDVGVAGTLRHAVNAVNAHVAQAAPSQGDILIDVDWLAQCIGLGEWYDERQWHLARLPCAQKALPLYADFAVRSIAAIRGKSRKCLVLDLDNTLWGGVIGDDGLEGIALNAGDARGEAFRALQRAAADLRRRGVVLAVCSKNDEAIAKTAFTHPGMILKEADFSVFLANWDDKATNLERIAQRLDIGLDALVFLDDNPVERAQVRQALPQVAVPELGGDPSTYKRILLNAGYFESIAFTHEDLARADQYKENAHRAQALEKARDLDEFLRSLDMEIQFAPFDAQGRKRITQLINKTNQFNLTTRRYTEQQVAQFEASAEHYTLQISLRDKFGDNGMISVVICAVRAAEWEIDSWLMSCRVLNRKVEQAVCNRIAAAAKSAGAARLIGVYRPTERNGLACDLFSRLGFEKIAEPETDGAQRWALHLERFQPLPTFCNEQHAHLEAALEHA
jgi:FkbH-like protein